MFTKTGKSGFADFVFDPDKQAYALDITPIAEQTIRGAVHAMAEWTEPRIFLLAMDRVRELDPAWWQTTRALPMADALEILRERYPLPPGGK